MTLDPVHFEGITRNASRIGATIDERDQQHIAETVWCDFLDPLVDDSGRPVLEPLGEQRLREVDVESAALRESPYPTSHGLDSGTINPTSFKNGLVLDVAQAAMAAEPSDLDLHRRRTLITTVHTDDPVTEFDEPLDDGYTESRLLQAPRVSRFEESVVHELALYIAESEHALRHAHRVEDLFALDGPIYPKGMLNWADRDPELADLLYADEGPREVIANYVELVDRFVERDCPLVGFVKNPSTKALTRTLRERSASPSTPWVDDTAFFTRLLERVTYERTVDENGNDRLERSRETDRLTYTSWFRSRGGADRLLSADGDAFGIERERDPVEYEVTFFALYDPRDDLLYRIEAPYGITRDRDRRERLTRWITREVAAQRGPPRAIAKADELARIGRSATEALRDALADAFETDRLRNYDDRRWPGDG